MPKHDTIEFDLSSFPSRIQVDFENVSAELTLQYNELSQTFTVDYKDLNDDTHTIMGEPLTYGVPLWYWASYDWLPVERLVPMDESSLESSVTKANLQKTVFVMDQDSVYEGGDGNGT